MLDITQNEMRQLNSPVNVAFDEAQQITQLTFLASVEQLKKQVIVYQL
jgi:hypothetical protein